MKKQVNNGLFLKLFTNTSRSSIYTFNQFHKRFRSLFLQQKTATLRRVVTYFREVAINRIVVKQAQYGVKTGLNLNTFNQFRIRFRTFFLQLKRQHNYDIYVTYFRDDALSSPLQSSIQNTVLSLMLV